MINKDDIRVRGKRPAESSYYPVHCASLEVSLAQTKLKVTRQIRVHHLGMPEISGLQRLKLPSVEWWSMGSDCNQIELISEQHHWW